MLEPVTIRLCETAGPLYNFNHTGNRVCFVDPDDTTCSMALEFTQAIIKALLVA